MKDNECTFQEKLFHYLDDELPQEEKSHIIEHIAECSICREQRSLMQSLEDDFPPDFPIPADFTGKIMKKIIEEKALEEKTIEENTLEEKAGSIYTALAAAALFAIIFFFSSPSRYLEEIGTLLSTLIVALKDLPLLHLSCELFTQNLAFFSTYLLIIALLYFYFTRSGKNHPAERLKEA